MLWSDFQEKSTRNLNFKVLATGIRECYNDAVKFDNKFYKMKTGGATGHPILSCAANVVMTAFEKFKIQALIDAGTLKLYDRWVDDTFVRNKTRDRDLISREFHSFHEKLKFTHETAQIVERGGRKLNFIPVLNIGVLWDPETGLGHTEVYRKPTASDIVLPWNDFGPTDWKIGTLIGSIKRAYTHSSDFKIMHKEISRIKSQFRKVGYPDWLIHEKIDTTIGRQLYNANPAHYPDPNAHRRDTSDLPTRWSVLYLPWSGDSAGAIINKLRKVLPISNPSAVLNMTSKSGDEPSPFWTF